MYSRRTAELATVRFETAPGHQMQIDFGERTPTVLGVFTDSNGVGAAKPASREGTRLGVPRSVAGSECVRAVPRADRVRGA